mgnify:FL=1
MGMLCCTGRTGNKHGKLYVGTELTVRKNYKATKDLSLHQTNNNGTPRKYAELSELEATLRWMADKVIKRQVLQAVLAMIF